MITGRLKPGTALRIDAATVPNYYESLPHLYRLAVDLLLGERAKVGDDAPPHLAACAVCLNELMVRAGLSAIATTASAFSARRPLMG